MTSGIRQGASRVGRRAPPELRSPGPGWTLGVPVPPTAVPLLSWEWAARRWPLLACARARSLSASRPPDPLWVRGAAGAVPASARFQLPRSCGTWRQFAQTRAPPPQRMRRFLVRKTLPSGWWGVGCRKPDPGSELGWRPGPSGLTAQRVPPAPDPRLVPASLPGATGDSKANRHHRGAPEGRPNGDLGTSPRACGALRLRRGPHRPGLRDGPQ